MNTTLLAVYDGSNNLLMRFRYGDDRVPVSMTYGGAAYYLVTDQVGTVRAVANSAGAIVKRVDYDSFGNVLSDSNPAFPMPLGFAGGFQDRDTGLMRFGARDYQPETGRWVAKDPIDFKGADPNLYAYVLSDPLNGVDPDGRIVIADDAAIMLGLAALTTATAAYLQSPAGQAAIQNMASSVQKLIDEIENRRKQLLQKCTTSTGTPPTFPGPPKNPPPDPTSKWKLILYYLARLAMNIGKSLGP